MPYADPDKQRAAGREHMRRKRAPGKRSGTGTGKVEPLLPLDVRMDSADDVLDLLARQIRAVDSSNSADSLMKARVIGQLAQPVLKAIDVRHTGQLAKCEERARDAERRALEKFSGTMGMIIKEILDGLHLTPAQRVLQPIVIRSALERYTDPNASPDLAGTLLP